MIASHSRRARCRRARCCSLLLRAAARAGATKIERVVSPGGIEAWLVREPSVPLVAMNFAFRGGATRIRPTSRASPTWSSSLLDEGAGDLDAKAFQQRLEEQGDRAPLLAPAATISAARCAR